MGVAGAPCRAPEGSHLHGSLRFLKNTPVTSSCLCGNPALLRPRAAAREHELQPAHRVQVRRSGGLGGIGVEHVEAELRRRVERRDDLVHHRIPRRPQLAEQSDAVRIRRGRVEPVGDLLVEEDRPAGVGRADRHRIGDLHVPSEARAVLHLGDAGLLHAGHDRVVGAGGLDAVGNGVERHRRHGIVIDVAAGDGVAVRPPRVLAQRRHGGIDGQERHRGEAAGVGAQQPERHRHPHRHRIASGEAQPAAVLHHPQVGEQDVHRVARHGARVAIGHLPFGEPRLRDDEANERQADDAEDRQRGEDLDEREGAPEEGTARAHGGGLAHWKSGVFAYVLARWNSSESGLLSMFSPIGMRRTLSVRYSLPVVPCT